jgi:hypothetical protein
MAVKTVLRWEVTDLKKVSMAAVPEAGDLVR